LEHLFNKLIKVIRSHVTCLKNKHHKQEHETLIGKTASHDPAHAIFLEKFLIIN